MWWSGLRAPSGWPHRSCGRGTRPYRQTSHPEFASTKSSYWLKKGSWWNLKRRPPSLGVCAAHQQSSTHHPRAARRRRSRTDAALLALNSAQRTAGVPPTGLRFARQNPSAGLTALAVSVAAMNSAERPHAVRVFRPKRNGQGRQLILDRLDPDGPSFDFDRRRPPSKVVIRSGDLRNDVKRTKPRPNQMVK